MPNKFQNLLHSRIFLLTSYLLLIFLIPITFWIIKNQTPSSKERVSLVTTDANRYRIIHPQDTLTGKGLANTTVKLELIPANIKQDIKTDDKGVWVYQLPKDIKQGKYFLTLVSLGSSDQLIAINNYRIKVVKPSRFLLLGQNYLARTVYAQTDTLTFDEERWIIQMRQFGIWPVKENDTFLLYSEEEYDKRYCPSPCPKMSAPSSLADQIRNQFKGGNVNLLKTLILKLQTNGYAPLPVLTQYFPELDDEDTRKSFQRAYNLTTAYAINSKLSISDQEMTNILNQVFNEEFKRQLNAINVRGVDISPLVDLVGLRTVFNVFSDPKLLSDPSHSLMHNLSDEEQLAFFIGITIVAEQVRIGASLARTGVRLAPEAINEVKVLIRSLKSGEAIPLKVAQERVKGYAFRYADGGVQPGGGWTMIPLDDTTTLSNRALYQIPPPLFYTYPKGPNSLNVFSTHVLPLLNRGQAWLIPKKEAVEPIATNIRRAIAGLENFLGRKLPGGELFEQSLETAYIIPQQLLDQVAGRPGLYGIRLEDMVLVSQEGYSSHLRQALMHHELTHLRGLQNGYTGWVYGGEGPMNHLHTALYELSTDMFADFAQGLPINASGGALRSGIYSNTLYRNLTQGLLARLNNLDFRYFLEFAITGDANLLGYRITSTPHFQAWRSRLLSGEPWLVNIPLQQLFYRYITEGRGINVNAIAYVGAIGSITTTTGIVVSGADILTEEPKVEFGDDFLLDDYDKSLDNPPSVEIKLNSVDGDLIPGQQIQVKSLITSDNEVDVQSEYRQTVTLNSSDFDTPQQLPFNLFYISNVYAALSTEDNVSSITQLDSLPGGRECFSECMVTIPQDISAGVYNLTVYLTKTNSDEILASDSYPITILAASSKPNESEYVKQLISVSLINQSDPDGGSPTVIYGEGIDPGAKLTEENLVEAVVNLVSSDNLIKVTKTYSDLSTSEEYFVIHKISQSSSINSNLSLESCHVGEYKRECVNPESNDCIYQFKQCDENSGYYPEQWQGSEEDCSKAPEECDQNFQSQAECNPGDRRTPQDGENACTGQCGGCDSNAGEKQVDVCGNEGFWQSRVATECSTDCPGVCEPTDGISICQTEGCPDLPPYCNPDDNSLWQCTDGVCDVSRSDADLGNGCVRYCHTLDQPC